MNMSNHSYGGQSEPPPQNGWLDLFRRIQWLEWHAAQSSEKALLHGQDIRKLREDHEKHVERLNEKIETVREERHALLMKVFWGAMGLVATAMFKGVWELLTHARP